MPGMLSKVKPTEIWQDKKDHRALIFTLDDEKRNLDVTALHAELDKATEIDSTNIMGIGESIFR